MTITPKPLFQAQFAPASDTTVYTAPASTTTIIDKFTATNTDASSQTLNVNIVPNGGSVGSGNLVEASLSIAANTSVSLTELQNQILAHGDFISVKAGNASKVTVRASGREIT